MKSLKMIQIGGHIFCDDVGDYWPGVLKCVHFIQDYLNLNEVQKEIRGVMQISIEKGVAWFLRTH